MTDNPNHQIAQLQSEIAALTQTLAALAGLPDAQRPLQAQLDEQQRQLAALQLQTGGVSFGVGNTIGQVGDIVLGDKHEHHSPDPDAARRALLARYLDRLAADCYHLPLRGVEVRLDQGDGLALPHVYVMLATTARSRSIWKINGAVVSSRNSIHRFRRFRSSIRSSVTYPLADSPSHPPAA